MPVKISRGFRDISLSFKRHPITNDVIPLKNEDAIKKSVINLVRTKVGERFFNDLLGTSVGDTLFELNSFDNDVLREEIIALLGNYEPRITLTNVFVELIRILTIFSFKLSTTSLDYHFQDKI